MALEVLNILRIPSEKCSIFRRATGGFPCLDNLAEDSFVVTFCVVEILRRPSGGLQCFSGGLLCLKDGHEVLQALKSFLSSFIYGS